MRKVQNGESVWLRQCAYALSRPATTIVFQLVQSTEEGRYAPPQLCSILESLDSDLSGTVSVKGLLHSQ